MLSKTLMLGSLAFRRPQEFWDRMLTILSVREDTEFAAEKALLRQKGHKVAHYVCREKMIPVVQTFHNTALSWETTFLQDGHVWEDCLTK